MIIAAMGTVGYTVAQSLSGVLAQSTTTALALRNHLEADMMHDALRGDVLSALHAGPAAEAAVKDAVKADVSEHIENFRSRIAGNQELPLSSVISAALQSVAPARKSTRLKLQSLMRNSYAVFCLKYKKHQHTT